MNHTPTPWTVRGNNLSAAVIIGGPMQQFVHGKAQSQIALALGADWMKEGESEANAAHIVKCVNAHDELVAALRYIASQGDADLNTTTPAGNLVQHARAALAKVQS